MTVLVTGGGGFLGKHIVAALLKRGEAVRVFGRHHYPEVEKLGAECFIGDIRDKDALLAACDGIKTVFHVAAMAGIWGERRIYHEINIKGTANVIQCCLERKIEYLVYTSSPSAVIGEHDIEGASEAELPYVKRSLATYPTTKAIAEKMVLDANGWEMVIEDEGSTESRVCQLKTTALRPHLIWGPGDPHLIPRIIESAKAGKLIQVGNGANRVDLTFVENAAQAHLAAADAIATTGQPAGKAYFIGDEAPVVLWDWINELLQRLQVPTVKRKISYQSARRIGAVLEILYRLLRISGEPRMTRFLAVQLSKSHYFSHKRAEKDFGYEPAVGNEEGLQRLIQSLQQT